MLDNQNSNSNKLNWKDRSYMSFCTSNWTDPLFEKNYELQCWEDAHNTYKVLYWMDLSHILEHFKRIAGKIEWKIWIAIVQR